jgi:hypothetical protein
MSEDGRCSPVLSYRHEEECQEGFEPPTYALDWITIL